MDPGAAPLCYCQNMPLSKLQMQESCRVAVKHRAENLTYCDVLTKFGNDRIETMVAVRGALIKLEELHVLKNITDV